MGGNIGDVKQLSIRSLESQTSTGIKAWLIFLPIVLIDGFVLEFVLASDPRIEQGLVLMGLAGLAYLIAGVWYLLAHQWIRIKSGSKHAAIYTVLALWLAGVTWSWILVATASWSGNETINAWQVSDLLLALGIGGAQMTIGTLAAIVLYAQDRARSATDQLVRVEKQFRTSQSNMVAIRLGVQFQFRSWINHVLEPALERLRSELMSHSTGAVFSVDEVREHIVRSTSQRLHPRMVELGPSIAIAAIMRAHGISPTNISVSTQVDVNLGQIAVLTRCLDVVLSQQEDLQIRVALESDPVGVRFTISSDTDSVTAASPEIEARVQQLGGTVLHSSSQDLIMYLPHSDSRSKAGPQIVARQDISVPVLVALGLVVPTAVIIGLLGGTWIAVVLGSLTVMSSGFLAHILPVSALVDTHSRPRRIIGAVAIITVGVATSGLVTLVWQLVQPSLSSVTAQLAFGVTNAMVISIVVVVLVIARAFVGSWEFHVRELHNFAVQSGRSANAAICQVDRLREGIASTLHSQVQARLVVAAAKAEVGDFFGAQNAIETIVKKDIPLLLQELQIPSAPVNTLEEFARSLEGVQVEIVIDPPEVAPHSAHLMEVAYEAMVNSVRHGRATRIHVHVQQRETTWEVRIMDNGIGVDQMKARGLGLSLVDVATGGNWNLNSGPQGGAELLAVIAK